jgi:protein TonB
MAKTATIREPELPWLDTSDDRRFFRLVTVMLLLFVGAGIVLNTIQLPEVVRQNLVDVSPRLAKLILEKQKVKPPPLPEAPLPEKEVKKKKEPPKPEKKKEAKKKEVEKKKVKKKSAREVAENSGLLAARDELEDMRELFNLDDISSQPQQTSGSEAVKIASSSALLTAGAQQSSGGIQTDTLNRNITTSELAQRKTTSVESKIASGDEQLASASQKSKTNGTTGGKRSSGEIERVFQVNKGAIFNIYNRALRKNPSLAGKVVVELTIASNGEVTNVKILSSELGDKALERKLVLKIKRFKFSKSNKAETTVTYPIDFLPS